MRRILHIVPVIAVPLLLSTLSYGQSWSNLISSSRAIDWSSAGLPATLPDGETTPNPWTPPTRTQCGSTIAAGASITAINSALAACAPGTYVLLGAGTFTFNSATSCYAGSNTCIQLYTQNGVTLRGSGPMLTILQLSGYAAVQFGVAWASETCSWTAGYSPGATSITVSGCTTPLVAGEILQLRQCDSGFSGSGCTAGSSTDNGALYVCGQNSSCSHDATSGAQAHQVQTVYVTNVSGSTVTFKPGIYMPNFSSGNSPYVAWTTSSSGGNTAQPYGNGLEDMTIYMTGPNANNDFSVALGGTYASWIKGVRFVGSGSISPLSVGPCKSCLVLHNYIFSDILLDSNYPPGMQESASSDNLVMNNIIVSGVPWEGYGGNEGNVFAYNYMRDTFTSYYEDNVFDHDGGSSFTLREGNQTGIFTDDVTHGTHDLNTWFRNYVSGWDPPYATAASPRGIQFDAFQRFDNALGNAIGSMMLTNYQSTISSPQSAFVFQFGQGNAITDPLTQTTALRWGNCDTVTGTCRFQSSEVPTTLSGAASPFQNSVPSNNNLPASLFLPINSHPSGGTGLSWWKVCTNWNNFSTNCATSQTQPFPPVGPDVTGGSYVNSHAYDIPAEVAFAKLPIDSTYQNSYAITGSSWSSGTETLIISGLPNVTHLMGGFMLSGIPSACNPSGGELFMTSSSSTTVSYALSTNPGSNCTGTMKFPDVRQFDERVYQTDSGTSGGPGSTVAPPTGLGAKAT